MELSAKLDDIENAAAADRSEIIGEQANWDLGLAVFATKVAGVEDDTVEDVVVITEEKKQKLKDVFWDMHEITSRTETIIGETEKRRNLPRSCIPINLMLVVTHRMSCATQRHLT